MGNCISGASTARAKICEKFRKNELCFAAQ
jgi:hypothetical protein